MELAGEEKKLKALFSDLRAADEASAPQFATVWNRAQLSPRRIRAFNAAFVAATALLVFGLIALAFWSKLSQPAAPQQPLVVSGPTAAAPSTATTTTIGPKPAPANKTSVATHAHYAAVRRRIMTVAANRKLRNDAKTIANWKSPTTALLTSPSTEIFSSLPELDQSATQLKSFLAARSN